MSKKKNDFSNFRDFSNFWKKKKNFNYNEKMENFFLEQKNFDGLLPILWTGHAGVRRRGRWGAGLGVRGAQGWRTWGAGLACVGRWAGVRGTLGRGARQAGRASGRRAGARGMRSRARGARGRGAAGRAELARHRRCARGHARCHTPFFCSCAAPRNPLGQPSRCLTILSNTRAYGALPNSYFICN